MQRVGRPMDAFEQVAWETVEIRSVADQVVVHATILARTKAGGAIQQEFGAVCGRFTGGKVGELSYYRSWPEALKAVGLDG